MAFKIPNSQLIAKILLKQRSLNQISIISFFYQKTLKYFNDLKIKISQFNN